MKTLLRAALIVLALESAAVADTGISQELQARTETACLERAGYVEGRSYRDIQTADWCNGSAHFAMAGMDLLEYSFVILKPNSIIRAAADTSGIEVARSRGYFMVDAEAIIYTTEGSYRWVQINWVEGLDTFRGLVREDRIHSSHINYR